MQEILRIERASFGLEAYSEEIFLAYAGDPGSVFLVAHVTAAAGNSIVAGYTIAIRDRYGPELISLAVRPQNRRQGIGKRLLGAVIRRYKREGAASLRLMVHVKNEIAATFYRNYGFRRTGRIANYYEDGGAAIRMRLALQPEARARK